MSLVALKKKTYAQKNLSGRGPEKLFNTLGPFGTNTDINSYGVGFSLVGGHRNIGSVGPTNLAKSVTRTRFKGITPIGNGGCCGNYVIDIHNSGSCCSNDSNIIKTAVLGNKGMIDTKYKWIKSKGIVKEDDNTPYNTSMGVYIDKISKGNICIMPANKLTSVLPCLSNKCSYFIEGKKYIRERYTKHVNMAMDEGQYIKSIARRCLRTEARQTVDTPISITNDPALVAALSAGANPPTVNPALCPNAWYYTNTGAGINKITWYFYGDLPNGSFKYSDLQAFYFNIKLYNNTTDQVEYNKPWITLYTAIDPQYGPPGGSFFQTRYTFSGFHDRGNVPANNLSTGDYTFYIGDLDKLPNYIKPNNTSYNLDDYLTDPISAKVVGSGNPNELVTLIAISTDSAAPLNRFNFCCSKVVFAFEGQPVQDFDCLP